MNKNLTFKKDGVSFDVTTRAENVKFNDSNVEEEINKLNRKIDSTVVGLGSVLKITFDEAFRGAKYTVTDEDEDTKEGTVSEGLVETVTVKNCNTTYTIKATANDVEYTNNVSTSNYFGEYSVVLDVYVATIEVQTAPEAEVIASYDGSHYSATANESGVARVTVKRKGTYEVKATLTGIESDTVSVTVSANSTYRTNVKFMTLTLTTPRDCEISLTNNDTNLSKTSTGNDIFYLPNKGTWDVVITKDGKTSRDSVEVNEYKNYDLELSFINIYGAEWDGTSTTKWSRTDASAEFVDPTPYMAGAESYGSPFDNLMPWAGMVKEERTAGTMVAIPKFWYKITQSGRNMGVKIADRAVEGFYVSPAHMDRGDGKGERDVVYIARYHCGESNYKSVTGVRPKANITRASARTAIHALGNNIWQADMALRFTIWLLYIVEFADWNSQNVIGYGCGNNSATQNMGYTDGMPYHTGTTTSSRTTFGLGTQYRNIEGLWDNVWDWCDGCYNDSNGLSVIVNPSKFSDTTGGAGVGMPSNGYPSAFKISISAGFPMFYPTAASGGSASTYSCDYWHFSASYPCVYVGGYYGQSTTCGLFFVNYNSVSGVNASIGCRLQELP